MTTRGGAGTGRRRPATAPTGPLRPTASTGPRPDAGGIDEEVPPRASTSFLQCRPVVSDLHRSRSAPRLRALGFEEVSLNDFYDAQTVERRLVRRFRLQGGVVRLEIPEHVDTTLQVTFSLLVWSIGFAVLRLSLVSNDTAVAPEALTVRQLRNLNVLERELDSPTARWTFTLQGGEVHVVRGNVRRVFDYLGFLVHERVRGRSTPAEALLAWSESRGAAARTRSSWRGAAR